MFEKVKDKFEKGDLVKFANRKSDNNIYRIEKVFKTDIIGHPIRFEYELHRLDHSSATRGINIRHLTEDEKLELTAKKYNL